MFLKKHLLLQSRTESLSSLVKSSFFSTSVFPAEKIFVSNVFSVCSKILFEIMRLRWGLRF